MKQKVLVKGPVLSQSGYGEQARFALRSLRSKEDIFDIYIVPIAWGKTGWISYDNEERAWIDSRIKETHLYNQAGGQYDISVQVTIPNEWERIAPVNIGYTAGIETTKVAPVWIQKVNEMDKIIVVSNHAKEVFENTTYQAQDRSTGAQVTLACSTPIEVVNYPVRPVETEKLKLNLEYDFNYLAISQWGPRKNFDNLINWFIEENFDQEVGLVLKTSGHNNSIADRKRTEEKLKSIVSKHGDVKCKVYLVHGDLTAEEMSGLYNHSKIKCLISTAHGEGYGLPLFEAAYNGLPIVMHNWSGQSDFLYVPQKNGKRKPMFATVEYELQNVQKEAVWNGVIQADSQWAFPKESSFKKRLREVRTGYARYKRNATKLKKYLVENFTEEKMYSQFVENVSPSVQSGSSVSSIKEEIMQIKDLKQRSLALRECVRNLNSQTERLELLKDSFKGETCCILSCGPTLTSHKEKDVQNFLEDKVVIAVKQAFDLFGEYVDFHTYNCANFKNYDYSKNSPISLESSTSPRPLGACDVKFFIRERNFNNSLSCTFEFDKWTYENSTFLRPYGPGIMYESVFYLAQHLGVSEIITIGWDNSLISKDASKQHFYDMEGSSLNKEEFIHQNEVANNPTAVSTLEHEAGITTEAITQWSEWLSSKGTNLKIVSDINPAPETIERVEI
jgi:glycosyltransferase involved in cell wall biosynthesis